MLTKNELTSQLKKLISIRSLSGQQQENAQVLDLIIRMTNKQATVKRIKNNSEEILLISNIAKATDKQLLNPDFGYLVHVDVVWVSSNSLWDMKTEQRKVITPQDKLDGKKSNLETIALGRGVSDMKFSIPIGISVLNDLIEKQSSKTLTLAFTTDEERGGRDGAKYLAEKLKFKPKALIVPDGGNDWKFVYKAKGIVHIGVTCIGRAAHGSRPWKGKNAISTLAKILVELLKKYEKNSSKPNWNVTMNPGRISGGESTNQVCDLATVNLDFRYPETSTPEEIFKEVNKIAKKIDSQTKVEILAQGPATYTDKNLALVKQFVEIMQKNTHCKIDITPNYGASDARHFAPNNTPILMMKPTGGDIHEDTEWISLDACLDYEKGLFKFITNKN